MPTLKERVDALETRADGTDEKIEALEEWLTDEAKLRELAEKRIGLLEEAEEIRARIAKRRR